MNANESDSRTVAQRLAEITWPPLADFVRVQRSAGLSWRLVERAVVRESGGRIDVSFEALRRWYGVDAPDALTSS